ncbi:MAG: hypothetical protein A3K68_07000 [Euryarchaeota archaeon RBG_16_68_13]|nr:MAG: hypothetical protein A3K68_07000 [Euryarchaeota archaeon RBG_16_68_13]
MHDAFEAAQLELTRWKNREERLVGSVKEVEEERRRLEEELVKVEQQVSYYGSLTRDMKREFGTRGLPGLLSSFRKP